MTGLTFTPFLTMSTNRRARMSISPEEMALVGRGGRWGPYRFTDLETGTVVEAQGAPCSIETCFCAAEIVRVVSEGTAPLREFE